MVTHDPRAARRAKRLLKLTCGTVVSEDVVELPRSRQKREEDARDAA